MLSLGLALRLYYPLWIKTEKFQVVFIPGFALMRRFWTLCKSLVHSEQCTRLCPRTFAWTGLGKRKGLSGGHTRLSAYEISSPWIWSATGYDITWQCDIKIYHLFLYAVTPQSRRFLFWCWFYIIVKLCWIKRDGATPLYSLLPPSWIFWIGHAGTCWSSIGHTLSRDMNSLHW